MDKDKKEIKKTDKELNEEELEYKKNIDDMITGLFDSDHTLQMNAYNLIKQEIITSTGTMTSIPKPLKFLKPHFEKVKEEYLKEENPTRKHLLGNLLCILVLVVDTKDTSLHYILENNLTDFFEWGQELIRSLSGEIATEFLKRLDEEKPFEDLIKLATLTASHLIEKNNESEAIDLLVELDLMDEIKGFCKEDNYKKICQYLLALSNYAAESTEQKKMLEIVYELYNKYNQYTEAIRVAIKLKESLYIKSTLLNCSSYATQLQMAYILARSKVYIESDSLKDELSEIIKNKNLSNLYKQLSRTIDIAEPKNPEDIFKSHLEDKKDGIKLESYMINMSTSIVNGFINAGHGTETLLSNREQDWLGKNKEEGLLCSLAGLGLVNLWDIESGPNEIEKFMDVNEMNPFKRGGYNLGLGILSSGVKDDNNVALAILGEQVKDKK